jgi:hypothetical protein
VSRYWREVATDMADRWAALDRTYELLGERFKRLGWTEAVADVVVIRVHLAARRNEALRRARRWWQR